MQNGNFSSTRFFGSNLAGRRQRNNICSAFDGISKIAGAGKTFAGLVCT